MPKHIPFARPMIGKEEREAVMRVLEGPILVHGPVAEEFEDSFAEFCGAPYAVSVSSCTAGMHLVYFAMGYGEGDEILVPAQTHVATAHAIELTGAKSVFVDAELPSGNIDVLALEAGITSRTRAIVVVHYLGIPVDMQIVVEIAHRYDLLVVEDCALALGAMVDDVHVGLHGDVGVFSFYPVKHLTTAEGGMVITNNEELAVRLRSLRAFGVDRPHGERVVPGIYDAPELGFNYRMSEVHAAIGVEQLKKINRFLVQRQDNYSALELIFDCKEWCEVIRLHSANNRKSSHYCMGILLSINLIERRSIIMSELADRGIGTSIYYPNPVPYMTYYRKKYRCLDNKDYVNAKRISDGMLALPIGPHLNSDDLIAIGETLTDVVDKHI